MNVLRQSKSILHVNYIHTYNKNFLKFVEYFQLQYDKNINQKLIFNFGSDGPVRKNLNTLWDWGPHVFSCLLLLIGRFDEFIIDEMKIIENNHKVVNKQPINIVEKPTKPNYVSAIEGYVRKGQIIVVEGVIEKDDYSSGKNSTSFKMVAIFASALRV